MLIKLLMEVMNIINPIINPIESVCGPYALFIFQCADVSELKGFILIFRFFFGFFPSSRDRVFEAEGKRWNNKTSSWNVVHWELASTALGLFSFSRARSMNWRKSKWKKSSQSQMDEFNTGRRQLIFTPTCLTPAGSMQTERMWERT